MTAERYDTSGLEEARYQPGSNDKVLNNLRGITSVADMEQAETLALVQATEKMFDQYDQEHRMNMTEKNLKSRLFSTATQPTLRLLAELAALA